MHAVQPGQRVRILTIQLAVPDDADPNSVAGGSSLNWFTNPEEAWATAAAALAVSLCGWEKRPPAS